MEGWWMGGQTHTWMNGWVGGGGGGGGNVRKTYLVHSICKYIQNTRSKDSLNRSQYTNTALLDTTP